MRLASIALATALLACTAFARAAPLDVRDAPGEPAGAHFPLVAGADAKAAERINQALFIANLSQMAPRPGDGAPPLDGMSYSVLRNDARVLSLRIDNDQCGNYCGHSSATPAFDAATGRHLSAGDLFTAEGLKAIARRTLEARVAANRADLAALRRQPATDADAQDRIGLYEECRPGPAIVGRMQVEAKAVAFVQPRCSNRPQRPLDDLSDHEARFPMAELAPWLSGYGRALLLGEGAAPEPFSPYGQVLRGSIDGRLPITLSLGEPKAGGTVDGVYFYDRYRRPIALAGRVRDGAIELEERESHAHLRLRAEGAALRGEWRSEQKTLPVAVAP